MEDNEATMVISVDRDRSMDKGGNERPKATRPGTNDSIGENNLC